ncbi:hypothetical protein [Microbacterium allomyrinae]|uniref:Uncharacterized protein n=1 Tax=Microbacterium allomyrinae TaxID=2830666 RepID=A0A9X1S3E3_9MICO|nr:hypothetical protein [Microbacterium allomyrinae]MCC2033089.1 hypothetical protein [Microbacterium allomyrinae]
MPRDQRLFMTFPIDIHRHPKLRNQPAEVKWAFVEMNGEARLADNDGRFTAEDAEFLWPREILDALVTTHPTRPLVIREVNGGDYVIRDYAEHQETRAARAARVEKNRANGAKGGRPRKNPEVTDPKPTGLPVGTDSLANETQHKAESESESELEDFYSPSKSQSSSNRASVSTDAMEIPEVTRRLAAQKGITSLRTVADAITRHTGLRVDANGAFQVAVSLLDRAKDFPKAPARYVSSAIAQSPLEVEQFIHERQLEVA